MGAAPCPPEAWTYIDLGVLSLILVLCWVCGFMWGWHELVIRPRLNNALRSVASWRRAYHAERKLRAKPSWRDSHILTGIYEPGKMLRMLQGKDLVPPSSRRGEPPAIPATERSEATPPPAITDTPPTTSSSE